MKNTILLIFLCGNLFSQTISYQWAFRVPAGGYDFGRSVKTDVAGNHYVTGFFAYSSDFDPGPANVNLNSIAGSNDVFLAKYDANGNYVWAFQLPGKLNDDAYDLAIDGSGDLYITGIFRDTVDFDPSSAQALRVSKGGTDAFIAKYSSNGAFIWASTFGSVGDDYGYSLGNDGSNNVYFTGYFTNTVDFDPSAGTTNLTSLGFEDVFIAKYSSTGNFIWANRIGDSGYDKAYNLSVNSLGKVCVSGNFMFTVDFDPSVTTTTLNGSFGNIFLAEYNANGSYSWAKSLDCGSGSGGKIKALCYDNTNIVIAGEFIYDVDFDPSPSTATLVSTGVSTNDLFVAKYDVSGNYLWAKSIGNTASEYCSTDIIINPLGEIYIAGYFTNTIDFDPSASSANFTSNGNYDMFIATYGSSGNYLWAQNVGGTGNEQCFSFDLKGTQLITTGTFSGAADFDPSSASAILNAGTNYDIFLAKYTQIPLGISEKNAEKEITIYPNPSNGVFDLESKENLELEIINTLGQTVDVIKADANNRYALRVDFEAGTYLIRNKKSGKTYKDKIVIIK